jgi:hypothetical protein
MSVIPTLRKLRQEITSSMPASRRKQDPIPTALSLQTPAKVTGPISGTRVQAHAV